MPWLALPRSTGAVLSSTQAVKKSGGGSARLLPPGGA